MFILYGHSSQQNTVMSCQAGLGYEPGPSDLKASALPIELTWQTLAAPKRILRRLTIAQLRTNKSPFLKSYLHKVDANSRPSPLCPLCNTHTHNIHHLFNCTHIRTRLSPLDLWTDPVGVTALLARWTEKLAGGPQAGTSDSPTSKGHGSG